MIKKCTMSIIISTENGWLVDHKTSIEAAYSEVIEQNEIGHTCCYKCPDAMFNIENQFMMDTQFIANKRKEERNKEIQINGYYYESEQKPNSHPPSNSSKKKRKKRKLTPNKGETESAIFHEKIVGILSTALEQLIILGMKKGALNVREKDYSPENNFKAREFAKTDVVGDAHVTLCDMAKQIQESNKPLTILQNDRIITGSVVNTMVHYQSDEPSVKCILGSNYLIPPRSSFLMSDITFLKPLIEDGKKYDLILLDPPWQNKSIKRKKIYNSLQDVDLLQLPVKDLCSEDCVVVVWVTNKQKQHRFVKEELFPKWNLTYRTHWYWLKVTKYGEPVVPLNDDMKRPYECLIIGTKGEVFFVPKDKVIISIPCATHSRKPPLHDVIRAVFESYKDIDSCNCLEMFARNLLPGWTSWGNEVLLHQHVDFFVKNVIMYKSKEKCNAEEEED